MKKDRSSVVIAASSAVLGSGLSSLVTSSAQTRTLVYVEGTDSMLQAVKELCPRLVLLDSEMVGADISATLTRIRGFCSRTKCLVLADELHQVQEAESAGADLAVLKGFPASSLAEMVADLLAEEKG
jgi:DNA-binding NarL/FixJ family response regulator